MRPSRLMPKGWRPRAGNADAYHMAGLVAFELQPIWSRPQNIPARRRRLTIPTTAIVQTNFGSALQRFGKFEDGVRVLSHAVALNPASVEAQVLLGYCLLGLGRHLEAEAVLSKARTLWIPKASTFLRGRALALNVLLRYDEALSMRERLSLSNPRAHWSVSFSPAICCSGSIVTRRRLASYRQALALDEQ